MNNSRFSRRQILGTTGAVTALAGFDAPTAWAGSPAAAESDKSVASELAFHAQLDLSSQAGSANARIHGGRVDGPRLGGHIIAGHIEWRTSDEAHAKYVEAAYTVRCDDGDLIHVKDRGHLRRGRVRTTPEFETAAGRHDWLQKSLFVGTLDLGGFAQGFVHLSVYRVS